MRLRWYTWALLSAAFGLGTPAGTTAYAQVDQDSGEGTPYYDEDSWLDVTDWFDGNDYNLRDEAVGRWGDINAPVTGLPTEDDAAIADIDWIEEPFGYYGETEDDWYYDYYDYGYSDWADADFDDNYEYSSQYYDHDGDGIYDAFASFYDTDGDGLYEDTRYYVLSDRGSDTADRKQVAAKDQQARNSRRYTVTGTIEAIKDVQTPVGEHVVARVKDAQSGIPYVVDLGPAKILADELTLNHQLTATGPAMKAGDHQVLLAERAGTAGQQWQIDRSQRKFSGEILDAMAVNVRGTQHQLVKLETADGKKLLADLGAKSEVEASLEEGQQLEVQGPAVRVGDRRVLMASSFTQDGKTAKTQRSTDPLKVVVEK